MNERVTKSELLKQKSVAFAEQAGGMFRARERRDRVRLGIVGQRSGYEIISVRGWGIRTVFPIMRTGLRSFVGLYVGSCSTERTGHLYEE